MNTIVKKLSLLGFIMMSSYTFTTHLVNVRVILPNENFTLVEGRRAKKKDAWNHNTLSKGPSDKTYQWNTGAASANYTVHGSIGDSSKDVDSFAKHNDWLWNFKPDGSWSLSYLNEHGEWIIS